MTKNISKTIAANTIYHSGTILHILRILAVTTIAFIILTIAIPFGLMLIFIAISTWGAIGTVRKARKTYLWACRFRQNVKTN